MATKGTEEWFAVSGGIDLIDLSTLVSVGSRLEDANLKIHPWEDALVYQNRLKSFKPNMENKLEGLTV